MPIQPSADKWSRRWTPRDGSRTPSAGCFRSPGSSTTPCRRCRCSTSGGRRLIRSSRRGGGAMARMKWLGRVLLVAAAYCAAGKLALLLAIPPGYATAIWPAAGIALTAVLVWGVRAWPGVLVGSFFVNIWTSFQGGSLAAVATSVGIASGIGVGAALQAIAGALLIRRFVGFPTALTQEREVGKFLVLGGPLSCLVNAT